MTKEDVEDASEEGEQECWFGEGGCLESSQMKSGSWRDCNQSAVNPATTVYGDKPGSILEDDDDDIKQNTDLHKNLNIRFWKKCAQCRNES